eukprot:gi/632940838/ref/XP_007885531.1/ PREDICTED: putative ferric-chelate reductase 1 [Callorhinchus milii]
MSLSIGLLLLTANTVLKVHGYSNGRVQSSCDSMIPEHGFAPQASTAPYTVSASNTSYNAGDEITVTVAGNLGNNFKGFLLEARATPEGDQPLGTFRIIDPNTQALDCSGTKTAVSHTTSDRKQQVKAVWIAPQQNVGAIEFRVTVLHDMQSFWINVQTTINSSIPVTPSDGSTAPTTTAQADSVHISADQCGTTKFCFINPPECNPELPNCYFMSVAKGNNRDYKFEISGSSNGYISIGLSDDKFMGNDDVYICVLGSSGKVNLVHAYTTGRTTPISRSLEAIINITTVYENGIIKCAFTSRNITTDRTYYILYAHGPASNGYIQKHQSDPYISQVKVDISAPTLALGGTRSKVVIKVHGALMLIAWMCIGSMGMIIARYFKRAWKGKRFQKKDLWFQIHRSLMMLTVGVTIIAFVLSFVHVQGLSSNASPHPFIGSVVMGLTLLQPTIAVMRPPPSERRRFIFNWVHRITALLTKVLAVATIFLGIQLITQSNGLIGHIMGGCVAWEAIFYIIMEIIQCCTRNELQETEDQKVTQKTMLLILYFCGNLLFLLFLLIGISNS